MEKAYLTAPNAQVTANAHNAKAKVLILTLLMVTANTTIVWHVIKAEDVLIVEEKQFLIVPVADSI